MKLFIWEDPYDVHYGMSCYMAVADTVEQARAMAEAASGYELVERRRGRHGVKITLGEPTHIHDLPYAEWQEWSE